MEQTHAGCVSSGRRCVWAGIIEVEYGSGGGRRNTRDPRSRETCHSTAGSMLSVGYVWGCAPLPLAHADYLSSFGEESQSTQDTATTTHQGRASRLVVLFKSGHSPSENRYTRLRLCNGTSHYTSPGVRIPTRPRVTFTVSLRALLITFLYPLRSPDLLDILSPSYYTYACFSDSGCASPNVPR